MVQERRVLEYITLGDNQTAVGFLLASAPDRSTRFYRDALCTIALAVIFLPSRKCLEETPVCAENYAVLHHQVFLFHESLVGWGKVARR
jgi:hypothetical protein